jgi:hypothetical protein
MYKSTHSSQDVPRRKVLVPRWRRSVSTHVVFFPHTFVVIRAVSAFILPQERQTLIPISLPRSQYQPRWAYDVPTNPSHLVGMQRSLAPCIPLGRCPGTLCSRSHELSYIGSRDGGRQRSRSSPSDRRFCCYSRIIWHIASIVHIQPTGQFYRTRSS